MSKITKKKLEEGFKKEKEQISLLIDASNLLYSQGQYTICVSLMILAKEELAKLKKIGESIRNNQSLDKKTWEKFSKPGSHGLKISEFYKESIEHLKKMGKEEFEKKEKEFSKSIGGKKLTKYDTLIKNQHMGFELYKKLNDVKKSCFYLDYIDGDWMTFDNTYTEDQKRTLAYFLIEIAQYELTDQLLTNKYLPFHYTLPPEINLMFRDPLFKTRQEYFTLFYSEYFSNIGNNIGILLRQFPKKIKEKFVIEK